MANLYHTWTMQPPRPMPSKNWWKLRAPTRGLIVDGLSDAPRDTPMITECTRIPSSRTCTATDLTDGYLLIPSWSKNLQRGARLCGWLAKKELICSSCLQQYALPLAGTVGATSPVSDGDNREASQYHKSYVLNCLYQEYWFDLQSNSPRMRLFFW